MKTILLHLLCLLPLLSLSGQQTILDLSGEWGFQADIMDFERAFENSGAHQGVLEDRVILPGTTDTNQKGIRTSSKPVNRLSRIYEYSGPAWYQKEVTIPADWEGKHIELFLERVLWISSVYVDGVLAGQDSSFSTPHRYDLTNLLSPGKHNLSICIDNRVPMEFDRWSHAFSEYTQTSWNGIVGKIELRAVASVSIEDLQVYPDVRKRMARITCRIRNGSGEPFTGQLHVRAVTLNAENIYKTKEIAVPVSEQEMNIECELPLGKEMKTWDEFSPVMYRLDAMLNVRSGGMRSGGVQGEAARREGIQNGGIQNGGIQSGGIQSGGLQSGGLQSGGLQSGGIRYADRKSVTFGMREYDADGDKFMINGRRLSLRGTLECAVFPLTGYAAMNEKEWINICRTVKAYGLNHIRFHSWCPPEAAFRAADREGVYLQPELPCWTEVGTNDMLNTFFKEELERILDTYGNHPSFVQMCMGNELRGDFDYLSGLIEFGKQKDPRHLYSGATAREHLPEDEYYVSHRTNAGGITTYGARGPQTDYDLSEAYAVLEVPGVAHEVGQRAVYPDFNEIKKYTGVLYPRNFERFRDSLETHGMLSQAEDFFYVSGQMTAFLYKESIEALLRTANSGGFQLLDLHDFPGQGTALVGILDPFWDSKGIITPEKFREFCGPTVPLLKLKKREYTPGEVLTADAEIYHYDRHPLKRLEVQWELLNAADSARLVSGTFKRKTIPVSSLAPLGELQLTLPEFDRAKKLMIRLDAGNGTQNTYEIWVYPEVKGIEPSKGHPDGLGENEQNANGMPNKELHENGQQMNRKQMKWQEEEKEAKVQQYKDLYIVREMTPAAMELLQQGGKVLWLPELSAIEGKKTVFQNHFWNPVMFKWEPMSMGTLVQDDHPVFNSFPTEKYTNWQWWHIMSHSRTMVLDHFPQEFKPLVQVIDTYERNLKQGTMFECRVGKGKLLMATIDFDALEEISPASKVLRKCMVEYASGDGFEPDVHITPEQLEQLVQQPGPLTGAKIIMSDSYETGNEPGNAIDGDPSTIWHTAYNSPGTFAVTNKAPETDYPHEIRIALNGPKIFTGFRYVPRQDGVNGYIATYSFYISNDGEQWTAVTENGRFPRNAKVKEVKFSEPVTASFIRLVAHRGFDGQKWASMAELELIQ